MVSEEGERRIKEIMEKAEAAGKAIKKKSTIRREGWYKMKEEALLTFAFKPFAEWLCDL